MTIRLPLFNEVWYVTPIQRHMILEISDWDREGSRGEHCGFWGLAQSTHPQTVSMFLSLIIAAPASRLRAELPCCSKRLCDEWKYNLVLKWHLPPCFPPPLLTSSIRQTHVASTWKQAEAGSIMPLASSTESPKQIKML